MYATPHWHWSEFWNQKQQKFCFRHKSIFSRQNSVHSVLALCAGFSIKNKKIDNQTSRQMARVTRVARGDLALKRSAAARPLARLPACDSNLATSEDRQLSGLPGQTSPAIRAQKLISRRTDSLAHWPVVHVLRTVLYLRRLLELRHFQLF